MTDGLVLGEIFSGNAADANMTLLAGQFLTRLREVAGEPILVLVLGFFVLLMAFTRTMSPPRGFRFHFDLPFSQIEFAVSRKGGTHHTNKGFTVLSNVRQIFVLGIHGFLLLDNL